MGQILMLVDRYEESITLCTEAAEIARQLGARDIEGHALTTLGTSLGAHGSCEAGIRALQEGLAIGTELGISDDVGRAYVNLIDAMRFCGRDREGADLVRPALRRAEQLGVQKSYGHPIALGGSFINYGLGRWATAAELAGVAQRFRSAGRNSELYQLAYTVCLTVATAESAVAEQHLARLAELLEGQPTEAQFAGQHSVAAAEYALWMGRPEEARAIVDEGIARLSAGSAFYFLTRLHRMGAWAEADLAVRARARRSDGEMEVALGAARRHERELLDVLGKLGPDIGHRGEPGADMLTAAADGGRAAGESDPAQWHAVAERWDKQERPYQAAYSRWREAEAYLEHGNRAAGSAALVRAARSAGDLGARRLVEAVDALARRARIELSEAVTAEHRAKSDASAAAATPDPFGLTARERDVLALIADGRTNREIAEALFISENTAGVHVSRILGKLHVSRRAEAASIAVRLGIQGSPESRP
jgi:DNA-binding CsgD family transcriptional regulator